MPKTWFITGAGRGLGAEITQAALDAGHRVIGTARNRENLARKFMSAGDRLLALTLDVTDESHAKSAVYAASAKFSKIDVLVNNAGYGHFGLFEDSCSEDVRSQFDTNVFGAMNVTRAILPTMRRQRSGLIFNLSSVAGLRGGAGGSLYCASKHAIAGFSESLAKEVAPFGIRVTIVEPGFFRTDFLDPSSVRYVESRIEDYQDAALNLQTTYGAYNRQQPGDPRKLAQTLVRLSNDEEPPLHFPVGPDAVEIMSAKIANHQHELDQWRDLSTSTNY
ncbi:oxidoreductase [Thalassospira marina]|uniref:Short-chain dehydrogenase/reductase n=1 Tax=Thalassospira marina TaxID=2048283 RepID=A0ABN5FIB5_9PROT|nr:oxidoreductase [Thalassospira marina]AUG54410.1 short-chain dehydrogenase/reductase [Thalassospira marina]